MVAGVYSIDLHGELLTWAHDCGAALIRYSTDINFRQHYCATVCSIVVADAHESLLPFADNRRYLQELAEASRRAAAARAEGRAPGLPAASPHL